MSVAGWGRSKGGIGGMYERGSWGGGGGLQAARRRLQGYMVRDKGRGKLWGGGSRGGKGE